MPIGTISMLAVMAAQIASSALSYRRNTKNSKRIAALQQEFEADMQQHNIQRAWEKFYELQRVQEQNENEAHQFRVSRIEENFLKALELTAYSHALKNWPLIVPPFVMKDQSLGVNVDTDRRDEEGKGQKQNIGKVGLHCILGKSNDDSFNKYIFPELENKLSQTFSNYWGANSTHPVVFYSGGYKDNTHLGVKVDNIYAHLKDLPVLTITPWIDNSGAFYFKISLWGIGEEQIINEFTPNELEYKYMQGQPSYSRKDIDIIVNELSTSLEMFVGYIADLYYWNYYKEAPSLPTLLDKEASQFNCQIYEDYKKQYTELLEGNISSNAFFSTSTDSINLLDGLLVLWDGADQKKKEYLEKIFINYCSKYNSNLSSFSEAIHLKDFSKYDLTFLRRFLEAYNINNELREEITKLIGFLELIDFDYNILEMTDVEHLKILADAGNAAAMFRLGEIYEYSIGVVYNKKKSEAYYNLSLAAEFIIARIYSALMDTECESDADETVMLLENFEALNVLTNANITIAAIFLSQLYYYGYGVLTNKDKAIAIIENLDDSTHPYMYYWGAKMVIEIYGNKQKRSIEHLLSNSANLGYIQAQITLMKMYKDGLIIDENPAKSCEYARKAMEQGCIEAISRLGYYYAIGYGVTQSKEQSLKLLKVAAEHQDKFAQKILNTL